jgi:hypothetical protein
MSMFGIFKKKKKKRKKDTFQCIKISDGVIGIVSKTIREENIENFGTDMFKNPHIYCEIGIKSLPLLKQEKKVLSEIGCLYFYDKEKVTTPTDYKDLLKFFENEEKQNT